MELNINLSYLKFHSFYKNNEFNNHANKGIDEWKATYENLKKTIQHITGTQDITKLCKSKYCHLCSNQRTVELLIIEIIKDCHPTLFDELCQKFENIDFPLNLEKIKIFQSHISSKEVVFFIIKNENKKVELIPLIFDLKHCIFKVKKEKPYRYKNQKHEKEWNHKQYQNEIKKSILNAH